MRECLGCSQSGLRRVRDYLVSIESCPIFCRAFPGGAPSVAQIAIALPLRSGTFVGSNGAPENPWYQSMSRVSLSNAAVSRELWGRALRRSSLVRHLCLFPNCLVPIAARVYAVGPHTPSAEPTMVHEIGPIPGKAHRASDGPVRDASIQEGRCVDLCMNPGPSTYHRKR